MTDLALIDLKGLEVYQSDIDVLCEDYIYSLPDPNMIYKSMVFKGLLNYIYNTKLKHIINTDKANHNNHYNFDLLDSIFFNIYLPLIAKYNIVPNIMSFASFVDISSEYLGDIKNGVYRVDRSNVSPHNVQLVKRWFNVCESGLADKAFNDNGIGAIFGLKARYGWQEAAQQVAITTDHASATPEQIAERYKQAEKPALIEQEAEQ